MEDVAVKKVSSTVLVRAKRTFEFPVNPPKLPLQGRILGLEGLYLLYVA
jgi:hypothetical protein